MSAAPSLTAEECLDEAFDWEGSLETLCGELNIRPPRVRRAPKAPAKEWPPPTRACACDSRGCVCGTGTQGNFSAAELHRFLVDLEPPPTPLPPCTMPLPSYQLPEKPRGRGRPRKQRTAESADRVLQGVKPSSNVELDSFFGVEPYAPRGSMDLNMDMTCYERIRPDGEAKIVVTAKIC